MDKIILTITSCKRYELLVRTISSLVKHCQDFNLISEILIYDDSSDENDRVKIFLDVKKFFKGKKISFKFFEKDSFNSNRRHMEIMKIWKEDINNFDYVFHLEDDWEFIEDFKLEDAVQILKENEEFAMAGFSWEEKKFPKDIFTPRVFGNFWEWYYSDKHELLEPLFLDEVEMKYLPEGHWVKYINWPYFGFRPAIHDIKKINTLGTFNDNMDSFELEFAIRYAKQYKSILHKRRICYHIGDELSSYTINNSNR